MTNGSSEAATIHMQQHQHHMNRRRRRLSLTRTPKKILFMKPASSATAGSGQRQVQRHVTEEKDEPPTEVSMEIERDALRSVMGPNIDATTRRR